MPSVRRLFRKLCHRTPRAVAFSNSPHTLVDAIACHDVAAGTRSLLPHDSAMNTPLDPHAPTSPQRPLRKPHGGNHTRKASSDARPKGSKVAESTGAHSPEVSGESASPSSLSISRAPDSSETTADHIDLDDAAHAGSSAPNVVARKPPSSTTAPPNALRQQQQQLQSWEPRSESSRRVAFPQELPQDVIDAMAINGKRVSQNAGRQIGYTDGKTTYYFLHGFPAGGYGTVYLATPRATERGTRSILPSVVAIKVYWKAAMKMDRTMFGRVLNEHQIMTEMSNLMQSSGKFTKLLSSFQTQEFLFFVMNRCPGNLTQLMQKQNHNKMGSRAFRHYAEELLLGIEQLHSVGIAHRDLKPMNILIDSSGHLVIADFDTACHFESEDDRLFGECGTVGYMAPEQVQPYASYNAKVDVWAYGVVIAELCLGEPLFKMGDVLTIETYGAMLQQWNFKNISEYKDIIPVNLWSLLCRLLDTNPWERITLSKAKAHEYFRNSDWERVAARSWTPPDLGAQPLQDLEVISDPVPMPVHRLRYDPLDGDTDWSIFNWSIHDQPWFQALSD